ncbi:MAG: glutamine-synthetase adenylyltransferase [Bdellovibrionaceae bacterium]|nr:glutamine-synthetase adenylyltransferase [Pseudobdellovibrionaceae bacterium]
MRKERNHLWNKAALAEILGAAPTSTICQYWSVCARKLLQSAFIECFPERSASLFALGKLGTNELNLSSDVDIVIVTNSQSDSDELSLCLKKFNSLLAENTEDGFVFRLDYDLRPGGRMGPLLPTVDQFCDYYGNYGETWERIALYRLSPICGDPEIQGRVLAMRDKFCFRRYLDYSIFEDLRSLRSLIVQSTQPNREKFLLNIKLDRGGIRDIELFVHANMVIHGGKRKDLQSLPMDHALKALADVGKMRSSEIEKLRSIYWKLRHIENLLQAVDDLQTHSITQDSITRLALDVSDLRKEMDRAGDLVDSLLGESVLTTSVSDSWAELGYQPILSRNKDRNMTLLTKLIRLFSDYAEQMPVERATLHRRFQLFLKSIRAKAGFYSLLIHNSDLLHELVEIFALMPSIGEHITSRPELLDSLVYRSVGEPPEDFDQFLQYLVDKQRLSELLVAREFLKNLDIVALGLQLTKTADDVSAQLFQRLKEEFPSHLHLIPLGKWGGHELGIKSDLDLVFLCAKTTSPNDLKLARRFISRMTECHLGGSIYNIDLRLRPTGTAGPLILQYEHLKRYLATEAHPWERQAYLKARCPSELNFRSSIKLNLSSEELNELAAVREKLLSKSDGLDLKFSPGGLLDIELAIQTHYLVQGVLPSGTSTISMLNTAGPSWSPLVEIYKRLRTFEQLMRLGEAKSISNLNKIDHSKPAVIAALRLPYEELLLEATNLLSRSDEHLQHLDPRRSYS